MGDWYKESDLNKPFYITNKALGQSMLFVNSFDELPENFKERTGFVTHTSEDFDDVAIQEWVLTACDDQVKIYPTSTMELFKSEFN